MAVKFAENDAATIDKNFCACYVLNKTLANSI